MFGEDALEAAKPLAGTGPDVVSGGAYDLLPVSQQGGETMYYGYGLGGIVLLVVLILLLTGRL